MQTTVESTDKHTVKLTVEVPIEELEKDLDKAYRSIANQVKIPGFRKGKVPKRIIDAKVGRDVVVDEFISESVPLYYRRAVSDEDLAPITDPEIDLEPFQDGEPLVFTATVEVRPRLELDEAEYKGVAVSKPSVSVSDEEIDEWIDRLRERFAELEPAERAIRPEDFVTIDLRVTDGIAELEAVGRTDYLYYVSSAEFGAELDAELAGKKAGDILKFDAPLPERFGEDLGGKQVSFQVLVKEVKTRRLPDADDAFAKTASEFDTLAQLRDDLRERLGELKEQEAIGQVRDRVLQEMIDRVAVDIPESLIEEETNHRIQHAKERAERGGLTLDDVLEAQGWDEARLREDSRDHAIRAIRSDLALEGVARAEKLEVTADELGAEITALAEAYRRDPKELAKALERSGQIVTLAGDIIRGKALDLLVEHADIQTESETPQVAGEPAPTERSEKNE
ncbi:MAG: trigger factor [Actinomycetota bacterium]|nr:trigger factor [Actinomycetota bacterium]